MPKVLFVAPQDPEPELGASVLYRTDVERALVGEPEAMLAVAQDFQPNLVVVKDQPAGRAEQLVRQLHGSPETRRARVVVILPREATGAEMAMRRAGASVAVAGQLDPLVWDGRLEELLAEPRRRDARIPARFVIWPHSQQDALLGTAVNLSVRGVLLESETPLTTGSTLELRLELPSGAPTEVVGQVVREEEPHRYGVDFIILRGNSRSRIDAFVESGAQG